jgi:hypothetical protein
MNDLFRTSNNMVKKKITHQPFEIKDCALAAIATGQKAQNLKELRDCIETVVPGSLAYHFWAGKLRPRFDDPEFNNDFAAWSRHALHDKVLAERLGMIDPTSFDIFEDMRQELLDIIEEHLDESEYIPWVVSDQQFYFITSQIVVLSTGKKIRDPSELVSIVPSMTTSSVFYHFIDAKRRTFGHLDDFSAWLYGFEDLYRDLCDILSSLDPFFSTLPELREQLGDIFRDYFGEAGR